MKEEETILSEIRSDGQIDILKGLAMISVIIVHSVVSMVLFRTFLFPFHIDQQIPIFFIIMGLNMGNSLRHRGYTKIKELYSQRYFFDRFNRIIYPFLLMYAISIIVAISLNGTITLELEQILGQLPARGPGRYFTTMAIQFILVFPLLYKLYILNPKAAIVVIFVIDISFQLFTQFSPFFYDSGEFTIFYINVLRYFSNLALGLWLSDHREYETSLKEFLKKNTFIVVGFAVSTGFLIAYNFFNFNFQIGDFRIGGAWVYQNYLTVFYPLMLVLLGIRFFPKKPSNILAKILAFIGKRSFHIYLVQVVFFSAILRLPKFQTAQDSFTLSEGLIILIEIFYNVFVCVVLGSGFYILSNKLLDAYLKTASSVKKALPPQSPIQKK